MAGIINAVGLTANSAWHIVEVVVGLLVAFVGLFAVCSDIGSCYLLMKRFYAGTRRERFWHIIGTLSAIASRDYVWFRMVESPMFRRVRMRLEHEIFNPRPEFRWPPENGIAGTKKQAGKAYKTARKKWKAEIAAIYDADFQHIMVDNPATINAHFDEIKRYFDTLKTLNVRGLDGQKFACAIEVDTGFIAPIHLLTGLLIEFNSKWTPILKSFDHDVADVGGAELGIDARQIQMFIYYCWLLWGPSIPICKCQKWDAEYISIQYGFGDENNSVEIVGNFEDIIQPALEKLIARHRNTSRHNPSLTPMALPASVHGTLKLSGGLKTSAVKAISDLPEAITDSWRGKQDERPVLFVSERNRGDAVNADAKSEDMRVGWISASAVASRSRYYSAYLWILFVVLGKSETGDWLPVSLCSRAVADPGSRKGREEEAWKDIIPFFEHGNLADAETCNFSKGQLAAKAVNAIAAAVRGWQSGHTPHRFAFACAIDESGCWKQRDGTEAPKSGVGPGHDLMFPDWTGGVTVRQLISDVLDKELKKNPGDPVFERIRKEKIIDLDNYSRPAARHDFAACNLPKYVAMHYKEMADANTSADED